MIIINFRKKPDAQARLGGSAKSAEQAPNIDNNSQDNEEVP
jgi:hypothetical protein